VQEQDAQIMAQMQTQPPHRPPFPWGRTIAAMLIILALAVLAVIGLLATGHIINYVWFFLAPALSSLIVGAIPVLQWFFPYNPLTQQDQHQIPQTPLSQAAMPIPQPPQTTAALPVQTNAAPHPTLLQHSVLSVTTPPSGPDAQIFHFIKPLPNPGEFYGRAYERLTLLERTSKRSSTALVGEYRIGKSWLMEYLRQVAPTHPLLGPQVRVGRLSATNAQCQTLAGFVQRALEELKISSHKTHTDPLMRLTLAARELRAVNILPVLCIDEFAGLIGRAGFDRSFVEGLRAVAEDEGLVLVTASRQPLHEVIERITGGTSPLFGIMPELSLQAFTEAEARKFVSEKSQQANFSQEEQAFFWECATIPGPAGLPAWPPLRLQQVGYELLMARYLAATEQSSYNLADVSYRASFQQRLHTQYQAVARRT
jgi:hypothetical protein